jgi:hypothetical protein
MISSGVESALQSFVNFFVRKAENIKDFVSPKITMPMKIFTSLNTNNDTSKGNGKEFLSISTIYFKIIAKKYLKRFNRCHKCTQRVTHTHTPAPRQIFRILFTQYNKTPKHLIVYPTPFRLCPESKPPPPLPGF